MLHYFTIKGVKILGSASSSDDYSTNLMFD